ncbi:MAG TPA: hypothetical protein VF902_08355 [Coriobacteriia bacterium]
MNATRKSGPFSAASILLACLMLLSAAGLAACGGTKESPGGPSGTGAPEAANARVVADDGRGVITGVLNASGITGDAAYMYMNYTSDAKDTVLVQGSLKGPKGLVKDAEIVSMSEVTVTNEGGTWKVIAAK